MRVVTEFVTYDHGDRIERVTRDGDWEPGTVKFIRIVLRPDGSTHVHYIVELDRKRGYGMFAHRGFMAPASEVQLRPL